MHLLTPYSTTSKPVRIFSYGGGVQSNAVLALQAIGKLARPYDVFLFCNVGEDSENPATLEYVEHVAKPFAQKHGIMFVELQKTTHGEPESLLHYIYRTPKSVPLPVYFPVSGKGRRSCTMDWKMRVCDKWIREQRYTHAVVALGISLDEYHRARDTQWHDKENGKQSLGFLKKREYPLIGLRLRRNDCREIIRSSGLPDAPKSSCWFCPYTKQSEWIEMHNNDPERFEEACALEDRINQKADFGKWATLHSSRMPLRVAVEQQLPMFPEWDMDNCESGYCFV